MICGFGILWLLPALQGAALLSRGKALKARDPMRRNRCILQSPETLGSESSFPSDQRGGVISDNHSVSELLYL